MLTVADVKSFITPRYQNMNKFYAEIGRKKLPAALRKVYYWQNRTVKDTLYSYSAIRLNAAQLQMPHQLVKYGW